jgi:polysaccharide deacetylase family protein (PEP-CTERM system associated)
MPNKGNEKIILTFDLEYWYDTQFLRKWLPNSPKDYLEENLAPLLALLEKYNTKATFFTTGKVIEKYPALIQKIHNQGHEIASHGYSHCLLRELKELQFETEIQKSVELIERVVGSKPKGFRAPNFSLNSQTSWALPILKKLGFKYDSGNKIPRSPLIEIPVTFYGIKLGGVYFRFLPLWLFKFLLSSKKGLTVVYLHPHELDKNTPVFEKAPWLKKAIKYYGVKNSLSKLEGLLKSFKFDSAENILGI